MRDKILDLGAFRELKVTQPADLKLLMFVFKKYLDGDKNQAFREKLFEEAGKDEEGDIAFRIVENLRRADKGKKLDDDFGVFISRNYVAEKVIKWLGIDKEEFEAEYNLQASAMGVVKEKSEKEEITDAKILNFSKDRN